MQSPHPWTRLTPADSDLLDILDLTRFELALLRRAVQQGYKTLAPSDRQALHDNGLNHRLSYLSGVMQLAWHHRPDRWERWLRYIGRSDLELRVMHEGRMEIGLFVIGVYSDLFAITDMFLRVGEPPEAQSAQQSQQRIGNGGGRGHGP